jgi:hypothetical protein
MRNDGRVTGEMAPRLRFNEGKARHFDSKPRPPESVFDASSAKIEHRRRKHTRSPVTVITFPSTGGLRSPKLLAHSPIFTGWDLPRLLSPKKRTAKQVYKANLSTSSSPFAIRALLLVHFPLRYFFLKRWSFFVRRDRVREP